MIALPRRPREGQGSARTVGYQKNAGERARSREEREKTKERDGSPKSFSGGHSCSAFLSSVEEKSFDSIRDSQHLKNYKHIPRRVGEPMCVTATAFRAGKQHISPGPPGGGRLQPAICSARTQYLEDKVAKERTSQKNDFSSKHKRLRASTASLPCT